MKDYLVFVSRHERLFDGISAIVSGVSAIVSGDGCRHCWYDFMEWSWIKSRAFIVLLVDIAEGNEIRDCPNVLSALNDRLCSTRLSLDLL